MCQKIIKRSELEEKKWRDIRVDSVIVSFCDDCRCQRTHSCVDSFWEDNELVYVFLCDFCRFNEVPVYESKG